MASLKTHKTSSTNKSFIASPAHDVLVNGLTITAFGLLIFFSPRIIMSISPWIIKSAGWLYTSIIMPLANLSGLTSLLTTVGPLLYNTASTLIVYISSILSATPVLICLTIVAALFAARNSTVHINLPSDSSSIDRQKRIERRLCELQLSVGKQFKSARELYTPIEKATSSSSFMKNGPSGARKTPNKTVSSQTELVNPSQSQDDSSTITENNNGGTGNRDNTEQTMSITKSTTMQQATIETAKQGQDIII